MINAYSVQTGESQCLNIDHCYVKFKPIGRIDTARMEDHLNSNLDPSVPLSVYQVTERERERERESGQPGPQLFAGIIPRTGDSKRIIQSEHRLEVRL